MFTMNIFSPYEAAKRLSVESKSLIKTGERYLEFLKNLQTVDREYEQEINSEYLENIQKGYYNFFKQSRGIKILILDTNNLDFVSNEEDYEKIKEAIFQNHKKRVTRIML